MLVNVKDYGAHGNGIQGDSAVLESLAAIVISWGGGTMYFPPGDYLLDATTTTLPKGVGIFMDDGARFGARASGKSLVINGRFTAGLAKVFRRNEPATDPWVGFEVAFGPGTVEEIVATWFGAVAIVGSDKAPSTSALQAALNSAHSSSVKQVLIPAGLYLTAQLNWPCPAGGENHSGIALRGVGSSRATNGSASSTILRAVSAGAGNHLINMLKVDGSGYVMDCRLSDLELDGNYGVENCINTSGNNLFERVFVRGSNAAGYGIRLANLTNSATFNDCSLFRNAGYGLGSFGANTTRWTWNGGSIRENERGGIRIEAASHVSVNDTVIEANTGPGLDVVNGSGSNCDDVLMNNVWFEANTHGFRCNSSTGQTPARFRFSYCVFNANGRYYDIQSIKYCVFDNCRFGGATESGSKAIGTSALYVIEHNSDVSGGGDASLPRTATGFKSGIKTSGPAGYRLDAELSARGIDVSGAGDYIKLPTGVWTPTLRSGVSIRGATGSWTRIGNRLLCHGMIPVSTNSSSAALTVTLPFPAVVGAPGGGSVYNSTAGRNDGVFVNSADNSFGLRSNTGVAAIDSEYSGKAFYFELQYVTA